MTMTTKLTNERIEELTTLRLEAGETNIINFLENNEFEAYMINIEEAIERTTRNMNKYKVGGSSYNCFKEMTESLEVLKAELIEKMESMKAEEVKVEVKKATVKKAKLTPTQAQFLEELKQAQPIYKDLATDRSIEKHSTYVDGSLLYYNIEDGRCLRAKSEGTLIGENKITIRGNSSTINSLIKKGYITASKIGGDAFDVLSLVEAVEYEEPMTQMEKIEISATYYSDYCGKDILDTKTLYCPVGQSQLTFEEATKHFDDRQYSIDSVEVINVEMWKGFED